jgi:predicted DCC family thiol-disulfide oxidoreductase YuxK
VSETVFYDGHCGLCHGGVKFIVRRDRAGAFRFAPLQGPTFESSISPAERAAMPDSMAVRTADGRLLLKSDAWRYILRRLGGIWKVLAAVVSIVPRPLQDVAYDFVARIRFRIFGRREDVCPIVPPELRGRFLP